MAIKIQQAFYGVETRVVDVTAKLQSMIDQGRREIWASPSDFGDPCPGSAKYLSV